MLLMSANHGFMNNLVSPITQGDRPPHQDFYDMDTEDEYFDLPQKLGLTSARLHTDSIKPANINENGSTTSRKKQRDIADGGLQNLKGSKIMQNIKSNFKDKVKNIKSDFNNLLHARGCAVEKASQSDTEDEAFLPSAAVKIPK